MTQPIKSSHGTAILGAFLLLSLLFINWAGKQIDSIALYIPAGSQTAQVISTLSDGLVAHYTFDDNTNDSVGSNNGTVSGGATYVDGKIGRAMQFDGVNDYVNIGAPAGWSNTQGTISLWVRPNFSYNVGSSKGAVLGMYTNDVNRFNLFYNYVLDLWDFYTIYPGSEGSVRGSSGNFAAGTWIYLTIKWDSNGRDIYINGVYKNHSAIALGQSVANFRLGEVQYSGGNTWFDGSLDDVRIYNYPLTPQEISDLYALGSVTTPSSTNQPPIVSAGNNQTVNPAVIEDTTPLTISNIQVSAGTPNNIYIAQTTQGSDTGTSCASAHSATWFNTSANWGGGGSDIMPGDTVHLCGTFIGTAGQTLFTIPASGSVGNPITIIFETGAQLNAPYWGSASNGAITISGKSYITIDGGSNGIIQNTANGSALANQRYSQGIYITSSDHIEIKNLTVQHIYDNGGSDQYSQDVGGVTTANIYLVGNNNNISIHNNTLNNSRTGIRVDFDGTYTIDTINLYNNYISDHAWGIMMGSGQGNPVSTNISIYNNEITGWLNWQCPASTPSSHFCKLPGGGDQTGDAYHTDGIILYTISSGTFTPLIYSNYIHGDLGRGSATSFIYPTTGTNAKIFNNLLVQEGTRSTWMLNGSPKGSEIYNNTLIGWSGNTNNAIMVSGTSRNKIKNNIIVNAGVAIASYSVLGTMISEFDHNIWYNINNGIWRSSFNDGRTFYNWAQWQALGYDLNSTITNPNLNSSHHLQAGSSAIGFGANLTSVGITSLNSDKLGNTRPSGSAWDIGAYEYTGNVTSTPGDFNSDGRVNTTDFSLLTGDWNKSNSPYDLNGDHIVNSLDYVIMVQGWTG